MVTLVGRQKLGKAPDEVLHYPRVERKDCLLKDDFLWSVQVFVIGLVLHPAEAKLPEVTVLPSAQATKCSIRPELLPPRHELRR